MYTYITHVRTYVNHMSMSHGTRRMESCTHISHVCAAHQPPVCLCVIAHAEWRYVHVRDTSAHLRHSYVYETWQARGVVTYTCITCMCISVTCMWMRHGTQRVDSRTHKSYVFAHISHSMWKSHGTRRRESCIWSSWRSTGRVRALQCVAVCCSVLQCVAVCCKVLQCGETLRTPREKGSLTSEFVAKQRTRPPVLKMSTLYMRVMITGL